MYVSHMLCFLAQTSDCKSSSFQLMSYYFTLDKSPNLCHLLAYMRTNDGLVSKQMPFKLLIQKENPPYTNKGNQKGAR